MTTLTANIPTDFVPADLDATVWENVKPLFAELRDRRVTTPAEFEKWLLDRSELTAACSEAQANLYIRMTCHTEDEAANKAYADFVTNVAPKLETTGFELDRKHVELASRFNPDQARYMVLNRSRKASVELFREENVPIKTELAQLKQEYTKIIGRQKVSFEGREQTIPQMARYIEETDRALRERAWRAIAARRLEDRQKLDEMLDEMIARRSRLATNAGCASYIEYAFRDKQRFDYTPAHCRDFWEAIERRVVPFLRRLDARRRSEMKIDALRPWDLAVDPKGRPPLRPFKGGRELFDKSRAVMAALDPRLETMFLTMGQDALPGEEMISPQLDLDSRHGKGPGGYQYARDRSRTTFIFMNAAGLMRDVRTIIHEAGHAFHSMLAAHDPLVEYRHSPIEFAEVASMGMEHLTLPHWSADGAYFEDEIEASRARREHLEESVSLLAWIATIDRFQHWLYAPENVGCSRSARDDQWIELDARYGHEISWEGLTDERRSSWQRQSHLYSVPMYYIEYGIAQLGALGLWLRSRREGETIAVNAYINALSLGGSKPLPELFGAAGLNFDFGDTTVARIVEEVEKELDSLDD